MAKPAAIELPGCEPIPILYEDRTVIAIDKPRGWMLIPHTWQKTDLNLQAAISSSIAARDHWSASRGLKFLRFVHRLDADTSGILLFARSLGAMEQFGDLFEDRRMEKTYLAVTVGEPREQEWLCQFKLGADPKRFGRQRVDFRDGKTAETFFKVLARRDRFNLVECKPVTGRTHQIRVHLAESGMPIVGDELYGREERGYELGLRAIRLAYADPFTRRRVDIRAPVDWFLKEYGFAGVEIPALVPAAKPPTRPVAPLKPKPAAPMPPPVGQIKARPPGPGKPSTEPK